MKDKSTYMFTRWIFMRSLGVIYLIAFLSAGAQILGLMGSQGILPVHDFLVQVKAHYGVERFWLVPTVFWFDASDLALQAVCWLGAVFSILLVFGLAPTIMAFFLWGLYLSITVTGGDFYGFQWDGLLLEVGLIAILFAERYVWPKTPLKDIRRPTALCVVWLLRLILFKLMFSSGVVKLTSGDPSWRDLTALTYHYMTQPLANPLSWFVHHWPLWAHQLCALMMFCVELIVPFFIFINRTLRKTAFVCFITLQFIIILTGNYCFFNLLAIALSFSLLDDDSLRNIMPRSWKENAPQEQFSPGLVFHLEKIFLTILAVIILIINLDLFPLGFKMTSVFKPLRPVMEKIAGVRSFNHYGLFAVMTTHRREIAVEGSIDGVEWKEYTFRHKPGPLERMPSQAAPHQPRLDWQMWFAALGRYENNPWFMNFLQRLLEGSKPVLELVEDNPFKDHPPKYVRAAFYEYTFTDPQTHKSSGRCWDRKYLGVYCPVVRLGD